MRVSESARFRLVITSPVVIKSPVEWSEQLHYRGPLLGASEWLVLQVGLKPTRAVLVTRSGSIPLRSRTLNIPVMRTPSIATNGNFKIRDW